MKLLNFYSLLLLLTTNVAFGQIFTEDFESGSGSYTTTISECSGGSGDYFTLTDGSNINGTFTGITGSFFAAQDIDASGCPGSATDIESISWTGINISGCTGLSFSIDLAEDDDGSSQDWDDTDYFHIYYSIDGGAEQNLIWVEYDGIGNGSGSNGAPLIDTDFNGIGDGTEITDAFTTFTNAIAGTGNTIDIRIEMHLDSGDEDIAFDNLELSGSCGPPPSNTITTGTVSPLSYTVDCSNGQTGTVNFTSTDVYNGGNVFTAELSDASGSFASPTSIGSLTLSGTDPSGTINITIPAGTVSGTGYRIRVVSSDPVVTGSDNGTDITITLTGEPCVLEPPHMTSLIINSCNSSCSEGDNEVIFGNTGDYSVDMNSSNIEVTYGSNPSPSTTYSDPILSNNTTTSGLNSASGCPGLFIDAAGTTLPPNSTFMLVNDAFCPGDVLDFSNFCGSGPIYVIYTTDGSWNSPGNFSNSTSDDSRYLQTTITATDGSTHTIDYEFDTDLNTGSNGDYAKWNFNGGMAIEQGNNGCSLDPVVLPVDFVSLALKENNTDGVDIQWETLSELNNDRFILYHSSNGVDFEYLTSVDGSGTTHHRSLYSSRHSSPVNGINYYMLRSVDYNGTTYLKGLAAIKIDKNITFYNNASERLIFPDDKRYSVYNSRGQIIAKCEGKKSISFNTKGVFFIINQSTGKSTKLVIK